MTDRLTSARCSKVCFFVFVVYWCNELSSVWCRWWGRWRDRWWDRWIVARGFMRWTNPIASQSPLSLWVAGPRCHFTLLRDDFTELSFFLIIVWDSVADPLLFGLSVKLALDTLKLSMSIRWLSLLERRFIRFLSIYFFIRRTMQSFI